MHMELPAQIVALCGKNEDLLTEVVHATEAAPAHLKFRALPYTTEMHEWMAISDLFIGKPGGLTLSEAMASALPMILLNPIPGQEEINAASILEQGVAVKPDGCRHASVQGGPAVARAAAPCRDAGSDEATGATAGGLYDPRDPARSPARDHLSGSNMNPIATKAMPPHCMGERGSLKSSMETIATCRRRHPGIWRRSGWDSYPAGPASVKWRQPIPHNCRE